MSCEERITLRHPARSDVLQLLNLNTIFLSNPQKEGAVQIGTAESAACASASILQLFELASLRNASGQTAADLAHAHGFHDCSCLISKTQKLSGGVHANGTQNGNSGPCGQDLLGRKRLLDAVDARDMKKARRAENVLVQTQSGGEELESMNMESTQELHSADDTKFSANGRRRALPYTSKGNGPEPPKSAAPPSPPASQQAAAPAQRSFSDMCGSLHLTGSPSSCVSHRPAWWGPMGAEYGDSLHYGHYHGFGDTAEELSDAQAEHRYKQAAASAVHLSHGS